MEDCYICESETTPADSLRCEGVCGRNIHAKCAVISKSLLKGYKETDNMYYICEKCIGLSMIAVNKKLDKVMSIFNIYDERVTRYDRDMKVLLESVCELKIQMNNITVSGDPATNDINVTNLNVSEKMRDNKHSKNKKSDAVILIKPKNNQNCDKTENDVKNNIDPKNIKFNKMCKGPNGGIAIVCDEGESSEQIERIVKEKLSDDYSVKSKVIRSKIKIVGIDKVLSREEILNAIKNQNPFLEKSDIKIVHSYEVKRSKTNETDPEFCAAV